MKYAIEISGKEYELVANNHNGAIQLTHKGKKVHFDYEVVHPSGLYSMILNGCQYRVWIEPGNENSYRVKLNSIGFRVEVSDERQILRRAVVEDPVASGITLVRAPIPGLVLNVEVEEKQSVSAGDGLIIMEAMKMENEIKSPDSGLVKTIHVKTGDTIEKDFVLIEIENS